MTQLYCSTVDCEELSGSPVEEWGEKGLTATVTLLCAWGDRTALAAAIVGTRALYPRMTTSGARAKTASIVPFEVPATAAYADAINYGKAKVAIKYEFSGGGEPETTELLSETIEPTAEFLTLDPKGFRWGSGAGTELQDSDAPGRLIRGLDYVLTVYGRSAIPAAALTLVECVNNAEVASRTLGMTFAKGTLLYNPPSLTRKISTEGSAGWDITYRLTYRPSGWNRFWRVATQSWQNIYVKGGGVYNNYPEGNFSTLFS